MTDGVACLGRLGKGIWPALFDEANSVSFSCAKVLSLNRLDGSIFLLHEALLAELVLHG